MSRPNQEAFGNRRLSFGLIRLADVVGGVGCVGSVVGGITAGVELGRDHGVIGGVASFAAAALAYYLSYMSASKIEERAYRLYPSADPGPPFRNWANPVYKTGQGR